MSPLVFDPVQRRVLDHARGPLLVLGGPGTGKTTLLVERFARLVEGGADPEKIVLLCLSRRGAQTARARILERLGRSLPEVDALTWHGLALRILAAHREALEYREPPRLLTAPEQYGRVAELLASDDAGSWPLLGGFRHLRQFGREVADFVLRAQERLLEPEELVTRAQTAGRPDLAEVGTFYGRYLDALNANDEVDFAGLLNQGVAAVEAHGAPDVDHVLVDDVQDVTPAAGRILAALEGTAVSTVAAADPGGHVFAFRGASLSTLGALRDRSDVTSVELDRSYRLTDGVRRLCEALAVEERIAAADVEAWRFAQPAGEADAVAREILRLHLEEAVPWGSVGVILRRRGDYVAALRRAFTHHGVPHLVAGEASAIVSEPAVRPIVQLLQFALRPERRDELLEGLLVSPVGELHPHELRALRRAAKTAGTTVLAMASEPDLAPEGALRDSLAGFAARVVLVVDQVAAERRPDEVFFALWEALPHLGALVARAETDSDQAANRDLDALHAFERSLARFHERRPWSALSEYLDVLEQVEFGPDPFVPAEERSPDAVRILSAHRAHGEEFAIAFVAGALEGEFPRLIAPRAMVDLDDVDAPRTARQRFDERFREERALFRLAVSRGRRVVLTASESRDSRKPRSPTRFAPAAWGDPPVHPAPSLAQTEAEHRRTLSNPARSGPDRLAALAALAAIPAHPETWWGSRTWTDGLPLHEGEFKTSYSRLSNFENCGLQYLYAVELGLDFSASHHMWLGARVHQVIEEFWKNEIERTLPAMERRLDELWRSEVFPSRAVEHRRRLDATAMLHKFWDSEREVDPVAVEASFKFPLDGALVRGRIDAIAKMESGLRVIDYKTGRSMIGHKDAEDDLQLGVYLLALRKTPELAELGVPAALELVYIGTQHDETQHRSARAKPENVPVFEARLTGYLEAIRDEAFAPSPEASCRNCAFKVLCPMWREGAEVLA